MTNYKEKLFSIEKALNAINKHDIETAFDALKSSGYEDTIFLQLRHEFVTEEKSKAFNARLSVFVKTIDIDEFLVPFTISDCEEYIKNFSNGFHKTKILEKFENLYWLNAKEKNSIEAYQSYINKYPSGKYLTEATKNISELHYDEDNKNWAFAKEKNNILNYQGYLNKKTIVKKYDNEAKLLINNILEEMWRYAVETHTIQAYEEYIKNANSETLHIQGAKKNIEAIEWEQTQKENSSMSYEKFLNKYPNTAHSVFIKDIIAKTDEEELWQTAQKTNKLAYYVKYAKKYPDGKFIEPVKLKIKELDNSFTYKITILSVIVFILLVALIVILKGGKPERDPGHKGNGESKVDTNKVIPHDIIRTIKEVDGNIYYYIKSRKEEKYGVKKNDSLIIQPVNDIVEFINGFIWFKQKLNNLEYKWNIYDIKNSKKKKTDIIEAFFDDIKDNRIWFIENGKWGFCNEEGTRKNKNFYEDKGGFYYGFAGVQKDGKWGYIDLEGKEYTDFSYDVVNFFEEKCGRIQADAHKNDGKNAIKCYQIEIINNGKNLKAHKCECKVKAPKPKCGCSETSKNTQEFKEEPKK